MAISLTQLRDQVILDANIKGNPDFAIVRLNRIINLAQRYVQAQLNGLGFKKWETSMSVAPSADTFAGKNVKVFGINVLVGMLESPRSIIFIEVTDGTTHGVAFPVDANKFQAQVVNTYSQATMLDPAFTRLANRVLLTPSTITSLTAYYYKVVRDLSDDPVASIQDAASVGGVTTVTAANHGLSSGDIITISGVNGMTALNGTFMVTVINSSTFTVQLSTLGAYISAGDIVVNSQIPTEFEDFIIKKAVIDIGIDQGKVVDKAGALTAFDNDLTQIFNKFYGTLQNENINQDARGSKLQ